MKKKNLKIEDLKVNSFTTEMKKEKAQTVKGGWPKSVDGMCNTGRYLVCKY